ncbi:Uncharacterised protein [Vibrio cholerae]|nr:Uncharacterised protein [Vibrio cholerae]
MWVTTVKFTQNVSSKAIAFPSFRVEIDWIGV